MNTQEYERMYRLEDSYWWFVGRHDLVLTFLQRTFGPPKGDLRILDIGCGTGAMSQRMAPWGEVTSADFSPIALEYCRRRQLTRLREADAMNLPFSNDSFDVVVALDILEHLPDDAAALREFCRVLRPGGHVMATVPAYRSLWSTHDVALMHFRRYLAGEVRDRFVAAGMRVRKLSYAMTLLFPVVWLVRRWTAWRERRASGPTTPKASLVAVPNFANRLLIGLLRWENRLIGRVPALPFGVSVFCLAQKPDVAAVAAKPAPAP